jgi:hypothetical protein
MRPGNDPIVGVFGASGALLPPPDSAVRQDLANEPAPKDMLDALSQRCVDRLEFLSPWRPFVTRVLLRTDVTRLNKSRYLGTTQAQSEPSQVIHGPSGFLTAYVVPRGAGSPIPPADVTWNTNPATATPNEILSTTSLTSEELSGAIAFDRVQAGAPLVESTPARPDSWVVDWIVESVRAQENAEFVNGAATVADPWRGMLNVAGISTFASTSPVADILKAIAKGRTARRPPNVAFVSTGAANVIQQARAAGAGPLLDPAPPLERWPVGMLAMDPRLIVGWLRNVPIVELDSLPNGAAAASILVGDFSQVVVTHRVQPNGLLARLDESAHMGFTTDKLAYRLAEGWDATVVPNQQTAIYSVTAVNAPAP